MIVDPVVSPSWIIWVIPLMTIYFIYQEWKKAQRFRGLRILSIVLVMIALAGILLHPKYGSEKSLSVVLLTEGYMSEKVDSILRRDGSLNVMHLEGANAYRNSKALAKNELQRNGKKIRFVLGQGIPRADLDRMTDQSFQFIPSALPAGITELNIPESKVNRKNIISGKFNNAYGDVWIYLESPGGKEDSTRFQSKGLNNFELEFMPKQSGKFLYTLAVRDSVYTYKQVLPVFVEEVRTLNILFLLHYPFYEIQYLKNFLERKNHRMVLRYQLSKNNFRYAYINHDPIQLRRITNGLLNNFDLVITDYDVLSALSFSEKAILARSIREGLGLLNLSSSSQKPNTFFPFKTKLIKSDTTLLQIGSKSLSFLAPRFRVIESPSITSVQKNKSGLLSGYTFYGGGKIGFHLIRETYKLALSGDSISYTETWTPILEGVAKPRSENSKIKIVTPFPWYADEPLDVQVISSSANVSLLSDGIKLPLLEDVMIDNIWYTRTWAGKPGWHLLETEDGSSVHHYVSDSNEWKPLSRANQLKENCLFKQNTLSSSSTKTETWEEIPPLIFYLMFIFSAGFIWLVPKLPRV